ncbi:MAG: transposase [gamma proteobacterium endosymbiont of Lamellibrachia anaximandri]|nr:transposase [gamma proteobacterium endosymbiont of Lamellibrachia anaximandri]
MARKTRLHVPGGLYHVMLRGNGGQVIFFDEADRYHLYLLIQQGVERYGHRVHGFCCMTNHIHLAIQVAEEPLSRIMQNLSFRYTRWINKKQARTGHLFQGRYKSILVDADSYLLELIRYIHLNPVRAGMVEEPDDYAWSAHRAYLGSETLSWLETDWVLSRFAKRLDTSRQRYEAFVQADIGGGYREEFHRGGEDGRVLADDRFLERVLGAPVQLSPKVTLEGIIAYVTVEYGVSEEELQGPSRNRAVSEARTVTGWLARRLRTASIQEAASHFHRDASTLSRNIGKIEARARASDRLRKRLEGYLYALIQA